MSLRGALRDITNIFGTFNRTYKSKSVPNGSTPLSPFSQLRNTSSSPATSHPQPLTSPLRPYSDVSDSGLSTENLLSPSPQLPSSPYLEDVSMEISPAKSPNRPNTLSELLTALDDTPVLVSPKRRITSVPTKRTNEGDLTISDLADSPVALDLDVSLNDDVIDDVISMIEEEVVEGAEMEKFDFDCQFMNEIELMNANDFNSIEPYLQIEEKQSLLELDKDAGCRKRKAKTDLQLKFKKAEHLVGISRYSVCSLLLSHRWQYNAGTEIKARKPSKKIGKCKKGLLDIYIK
ncbi:hypothetical protein P9112_003974 [Eukaryota sp. TZLM1-RC]